MCDPVGVVGSQPGSRGGVGGSHATHNAAAARLRSSMEEGRTWLTPLIVSSGVLSCAEGGGVLARPRAHVHVRTCGAGTGRVRGRASAALRFEAREVPVKGRRSTCQRLSSGVVRPI